MDNDIHDLNTDRFGDHIQRELIQFIETMTTLGNYVEAAQRMAQKSDPETIIVLKRALAEFKKASTRVRRLQKMLTGV